MKSQVNLKQQKNDNNSNFIISIMQTKRHPSDMKTAHTQTKQYNKMIKIGTQIEFHYYFLGGYSLFS